MARLRPKELPEDIRMEPFRGAEVSFFDAAKNLPDSWHILYGVTWYLRVRNNSWSEGEADFVLLSPEDGIVVVEVKGGRIGRNDEGWYSIDRNDELHRIKDPALQAANCKHNLLRYIKENSHFASRILPARHMVCFPNISEKDSPRLIDLPREMQILAEDMDNLREHIHAFADRNYDSIGSSNIRLSAKECMEIAEILKPNFDCPNRWSTQAHKQNSIIDHLTEEQSYLWDIMEDNDRMALYGPAGSGKTLLAMKLIKTHLGMDKRVLALVPSYALKTFYLSLIQSQLLTVESYNAPMTDSEALKENDERYSLVVIDEAQDLTEDIWLQLYETFKIQEAKKFLCIFDSNQRLQTQGRICPLEPLVPLRLSKILRNTKQIAEFSTKFFSGDKTCDIVGPSGAKVQFTEIAAEDQITTEIVSLISHYVFDEGFDYADIVVLFANNRKTQFKQFGNNSNQLGVSFRSSRGYSSVLQKHPIILADSVYAFRGLESKVVILTGMDNLERAVREAACYIGTSRARNILHIVAKAETIKLLKKVR